MNKRAKANPIKQNRRSNLGGNRLILGIYIAIFVVGLALVLYPIIATIAGNFYARKTAENYETIMSETPTVTKDSAYTDAEAYNNRLSGMGTSTNNISDYDQQLNITGDGLMGYIKIPKIDLNAPIYHGVDNDTLRRGIGHMPDTSLPVGGASTHAVLSGHRGLPSARMFSDIDQLNIGDEFYIHVLNKVLAYKVDQIEVVDPNDTSYIQITPNRDYVTLLTCTPYAINTHRLLVRGERTEYDENIAQNTPIERHLSTTNIICLIGLIVAVILITFATVKLIKINKNLNGKIKGGKTHE